MWSLLDHVNALVLVPAVVLLFLAVQMGGQEAQIASTIRASGAGLYETADWVERDLTNLGGGMAPGDTALVEHVWTADARRLTFRTGADTSLEASAALVRYEVVEGRDAEHLELRRYEVTDAGDVLTARSPASLRSATVALLDEHGVPVPPDSLDRARSLRVRLEADPPLGDADGRTVWDRRVHPPHLARDG